jgi:hypothetical protein
VSYHVCASDIAFTLGNLNFCKYCFKKKKSHLCSFFCFGPFNSRSSVFGIFQPFLWFLFFFKNTSVFIIGGVSQKIVFAHFLPLLYWDWDWELCSYDLTTMCVSVCNVMTYET